MNPKNLLHRLCFPLVALLFTTHVSKAQVRNYTFAQSSGTYTAITGGTVVVPSDGTTISDDDIYINNAIGFTFNFNNTDYTSFGINSNGFIWLGSGEPLPETYTPISGTPSNLGGTGTISGTISAMGRDLLKRTTAPFGELRVETLGSAPSRVCVIQFSNWRGYALGTGAIYNFQIRLTETTNTIDFVYGAFTTTGVTSSSDFEIGLRGADNLDFNNVIADAANWAGAVSGAANTDASTISSTTFPATGTTFTWTPGAPLSDCSGTPVAGTISGPASICSGFDFILLNTGATEATGVHYAWQSSANAGGPWANIAGQTNFLQATVSQTAATYYRFVDTCTISTLSAISNVLFVTLKASNECYCQPPAVTLHSFVDDAVTNLTIPGTTLNSSNATDINTGYTQVPPTPSSNTADLSQLTNYVVQATVAGGPTQVSAWVDFDKSGTFDPNEFFDLPVSGALASGNIAVPASALPGTTGLRIRARFANFFDTDPCTPFGSGETEDYIVNIVQNTAVNGAIVDIITPAASCSAGNVVTVKLRNSGSLNITAGAATVALYVNGANPQGPLTQTNAALLLPGDTATLNFTCSFPVDGTNIDSVFIQSLAGDAFSADDTLLTSHVTLPAAIIAPYAEDFEGSIPGWTVSQIAGSGNWGIAGTVDYPDYNTPFSLNPKSGANVALFNSYAFLSGTVSRLTSNCITLPVSANANCGYVTGFYFTQDAQYTNPDSVVVNIRASGGNAFTRLGKVTRQDSTLSPTLEQQGFSTPEWKLYTFDISSFAGQTVQLAFDGYGKFGNNMAIDSFFVSPKTVGGNVALAGGTETGATLTPALTACADANGWTYYTDGNSSRYLFGVQWDPSSNGSNAAAKTLATAKLTIDRKWFAAEDVPNLKATYTMQRYWDVNLNGATLTSPVNVRYFYSQRELDSIILAKDNFLAANPGSVDAGFGWFKTISGAFVPSSATVTPDGVPNAIPLVDANSGGATINGILYAQFNGVTSFSGGTAESSVGHSIPLPVGLLSFNAQRTGRVNTITWSTTQEINTSRFVVERSTDGRDYNAIGQVAAAGNSNNTRNYSFIDNTPTRGINYYRLRIMDVDSREKFSPVKNVRNEGTADIAVYPNPVIDVMQVNITSDRLDRASISVTDMNGKLVYVKAISLNEGSNYLNINTAHFSTGTYVIKIQLNDDLVVRKFNKL